MPEIVKNFCDKFCHVDSDSFADMFIDDAEYIDSLYGLYKGRKSIKDFHKRCHHEAINYKFIPKDIFPLKNKFAFEWDFYFTPLTSFSDKKGIYIVGCSILEAEGEKISSYKEYTDSIAILLGGGVADDKIIRFYRKKYFCGR